MTQCAALGIDMIDRQHAQWIQIIEEFRSACSQQLLDHAGFTAAEQALKRLVEYTRMHFDCEERLMAEHGYPHLEDHRKKHNELEAVVHGMMEEIQKSKAKFTPLKLNLLGTIWLFEHITKEDISFGQFFHSVHNPA